MQSYESPDFRKVKWFQRTGFGTLFKNVFRRPVSALFFFFTTPPQRRWGIFFNPFFLNNNITVNWYFFISFFFIYLRLKIWTVLCRCTESTCLKLPLNGFLETSIFNVNCYTLVIQMEKLELFSIFEKMENVDHFKLKSPKSFLILSNILLRPIRKGCLPTLKTFNTLN